MSSQRLALYRLAASIAIVFLLVFSAQSAGTKLTDSAAWTYGWNAPQVSQYQGRAFIGIWRERRPCIVEYDLRTKSEARSIDLTPASTYDSTTDDHDNPGILVKHDGNLLATWSEHSGDSFCAVTSSPGDIASFGSPITVNSTNNETYCQLIEVDDSNHTIYWFFRRAAQSWFYRTSTDGGATWNPAVEFLTNGTERPYPLFRRTNDDRVDLTFTDGNPAEVDPSTIHHGYIVFGVGGGFDVYQTDGTPIGDEGDAPFDDDAFTTVVNESPATSRLLDARTYGDTPVVLYSTITTATPSSHTYKLATWNGLSWDTETIVAAGETADDDTIMSTNDTYSGGGALDPGTPTIAYLSREIDGSANDWRIEEYTDSAGWAKTADISGNTASKNFRPVAFQYGSTTYVLWLEGSYTSWSNFDSNLYIYPAPSFRSAKTATPALRSEFIPAGTVMYLGLQDGSGTPTDLMGTYTLSTTGTLAWGSDSLGSNLSGFTTTGPDYVSADALASAWDGGSYPKWIACLFTNSDTTTDQTLFSFGDQSAAFPFVIFRINAGAIGSIRYAQNDNANTPANLVVTSQPCNDGSPHVMMSVSPTDSIHRLYFDGAHVGTDTTALGSSSNLDAATMGVLRRSTNTSPAVGAVIHALIVGTGVSPQPEQLHEDLINGRLSGAGPAVNYPIPSFVHHYHSQRQ